MRRTASTNLFAILAIGSLVLIAGLGWFLFSGSGRSSSSTGDGKEVESLFVYCAAGMRYPMEKVSKAYEEEFGIEIPDEDAEGLLSVGDAVDYIDQKLN